MGLGAMQVDLEVGAVNEAGLRGAKAMRDMQQYQMAVRLKKYMAVPLAEWNRSTEVSADPQSLHQVSGWQHPLKQFDQGFCLVILATLVISTNQSSIRK